MCRCLQVGPSSSKHLQLPLKKARKAAWGRAIFCPPRLDPGCGGAAALSSSPLSITLFTLAGGANLKGAKWPQEAGTLSRSHVAFRIIYKPSSSITCPSINSALIKKTKYHELFNDISFQECGLMQGMVYRGHFMSCFR